MICESSGPFFKQSKKWQTSRATGHLFLLFFFLFSFFLLITLGFFLLFPLAFVFFSLITHICFSLFESGFPRWLLPTPLFDVRASRQPPGKRVPLVFVPRSGRYGAGGKTWRHISQSGRVPPDRRLAFAPNGHEPRLLVAREPRWAEVTVNGGVKTGQVDTKSVRTRAL